MRKGEKLVLVDCLDRAKNQVWVPVKNILCVYPNIYGKENTVTIHYIGEGNGEEYATCDFETARKAMEFIG